MTTYIRLFLYARKSSKRKDRQMLSIPRQLAELREIARRNNIIIVEEFIERHSAKKPGRPLFNAMMARLEAGEADGILAWHPNRISRNSGDTNRLINLLDSGVIKTLQFPSFWFENTPNGKYNLSMALVQSKYEIDALSDLTKGGFREKIRRKEYPSMAPIGYLNDTRSKQIVVDSERAPFIRSVYERYATGKETLDTLGAFLAARGVLSKNRKLICHGELSKILRNPFYYGHFRWAGEIHEGGHEAIITKGLFDRVQAVLDKRWRGSSKMKQAPPKAFVQLLRCGECVGSITAEVQKGHVYYRCSKKKKLDQKCSQPYLREEHLSAQISHLLSPFSLSEVHAREMLALLENDRRQAVKTSAALIAQKEALVEKLQTKLANLKNMLLDGLIDHAEASKDRFEFLEKKKILEEEIDTLSRNNQGWLEPFRKWIFEAQQIGRIAKEGQLTEKAAFAKKVFGSNLVLEQKEAHGVAVNPWAILLENDLPLSAVQLYAAARTYFQDHPSPQ